MDFTEVINSRYSCKSFDGNQITQEQLNCILEAGRIAPTAKNLQEQRIYVIQSKEWLSIIDQMTPCRYGAPTILAIAYDKNNVYTYPGDRGNSGIEDVTIVATHMMLAAKAVGVDSCWINRFDAERLEKELSLPEQEEVFMLLDLGYPAENGTPLPNHWKRKELSDTVTYL